MFKKLIAVLVFFGVAATSANAVILLGGNQLNELFTVDTVTGVKTVLGSIPSSTELEYDVLTGKLYSERSGGVPFLYDINPGTGAVNGFSTHAFGALNGMEFVGATLYATFITGPGGPSGLVTIDPTTGAIVIIGATGFGPITGLAWDGSTMYGVTSGSGGLAADLVTLDLLTGAATSVGTTGIDRVGALEFGSDGVLYAGTSQNSATPGALYSINPATGAASLLHTGFGSITGLTSTVPEPGTLALLGLGLAGLAATRRRKQ